MVWIAWTSVETIFVTRTVITEISIPVKDFFYTPTCRLFYKTYLHVAKSRLQFDWHSESAWQPIIQSTKASPHLASQRSLWPHNEFNFSLLHLLIFHYWAKKAKTSPLEFGPSESCGHWSLKAARVSVGIEINFINFISAGVLTSDIYFYLVIYSTYYEEIIFGRIWDHMNDTTMFTCEMFQIFLIHVQRSWLL